RKLIEKAPLLNRDELRESCDTTLGHRVKRSWVSLPSQAIPGIPLDTAPKGVETHPGDGRLSVGNPQSTSLIAYIPCEASAAAQLAPDFQNLGGLERPLPDRSDILL